MKSEINALNRAALLRIRIASRSGVAKRNIGVAKILFRQINFMKH